VTRGRNRTLALLRQARRLLLALTLLAAIVAAERASEWLKDPGRVEAADAGALPADALGPCRAQKVVDGDTAHLRCGGQELRVRLLRIDTPERGEPGYAEATRALRGMLTDRDVHLAHEEPGHAARGNYGRLLAYLFADGKNVNVEMVRRGWSRFDTRWGEGRFAPAFRAAEREAERAERL
jgi:endonuclease YncB( thermonuclease family)